MIWFSCGLIALATLTLYAKQKQGFFETNNMLIPILIVGLGPISLINVLALITGDLNE